MDLALTLILRKSAQARLPVLLVARQSIRSGTPPRHRAGSDAFRSLAVGPGVRAVELCRSGLVIYGPGNRRDDLLDSRLRTLAGLRLF